MLSPSHFIEKGQNRWMDRGHAKKDQSCTDECGCNLMLRAEVKDFHRLNAGVEPSRFQSGLCDRDSARTLVVYLRAYSLT